LSNILVIGFGGFIGAVLRYFLTNYIHASKNIIFPLGTLLVNVVGCFFIGLLMYLTQEKFLITSNMRLMLVTGLLGSFTTFSAFGFETLNLIKTGDVPSAVLNIILNVLLGIGAVFLGKYFIKIFI